LAKIVPAVGVMWWAAAGASPRLTPSRERVALERAIPLALGAVRRLAVGRVTRSPKVFEASGIVGVLAHEVQQRVAGFRCGADRLEAVNRGHLALLVGKNASWGATRGAFAFSLDLREFYVVGRTDKEGK
jgi:hypothetical protein